MNSIIKQIKELAIGAEVDPVTYDKTVNPEDTLADNVATIINNALAILGTACVIVIIIGGVNYMTSSGDAGKVKKAKDTILYGAIGLIICVLAFAITNFVVMGILKNTGE